MRVQSQLVLFFVCFNAAMGLVTALNGLGIIQLQGTIQNNAPSTVSEAAVQYGDAATVAKDWSDKPPTVLGMIGDILGSIPWYFSMLFSVFAGFPMLIFQLTSSFALDAVASQVVLIFDIAITAVWGLLMFSFVIELVSGRFLNEG